MDENAAIVCFSVTGETYFPDGNRVVEVGNTRIAADILSGIIGTEVMDIIPSEAYPDSFKGQCDRAKAELAQDARPNLSSCPDVSSATDVYLLYPNWCGTVPMPVATFIDSNDWKGKRIHPVCTNEGSGLGSSEEHLSKLAPAADVCRGLSIRGHAAPESKPLFENWLKSEAD